MATTTISTMNASSKVVKSVEIAPTAQLFADDEYSSSEKEGLSGVEYENELPDVEYKEEQSDVKYDGEQFYYIEDEVDQSDVEYEEEHSDTENEEILEEAVDWSALEMLAEVCVEVGKYEGLWE